MCGQLLQTVSSAKYLGVTLSNDLSWHNQVCTVAQRSNSALHLIARNLHNCPKATRALAYTTLVRPKMEYCAAVWDPHLKEDVDVLERVNRRAARMVHNLGWYEQGVSPTALLSDLGWQTLATRRKHQRLHLMFNISHGLVAVPPTRLVKHERLTRGHSRKYKVLSSTHNKVKNSFYHRTIPTWNSLPEDAVSSDTLASFKSKLQA